jgi:hypothetical protein
MVRKGYPRMLMGALGIALVALMAAPAATAGATGAAASSRPKPPSTFVGQLSARWWQWLYQTPVNVSPEFSPAGTPSAPTTVDCSAGQSGHVWFLGGTFAPTSTTPTASRSDVYRSCSIPAGTFLFFPILDSEWDNLFCPNTNFTAQQLVAAAELGINDIVPGSMSAVIDGFSVPGLHSGHSIFRALSPWFSYTFPADNVGQFFGCNFPAGTMPPPVGHHPGAIADGVYLLLPPLAPGVHTIHFGGEINIPSTPPPAPPAGPVDFIENINYTITVVPTA